MGMIGNTLAQGLISGANIQDGTVDTPDLKDSAVTTAKVADGAVTNAKINDVAASKVTGTVGTSQIADGAVTAAKLASTAVTDNLGYTPVNKAGDSFSGLLKNWAFANAPIISGNWPGSNYWGVGGADGVTAHALRLGETNADGTWSATQSSDITLYLGGQKVSTSINTKTFMAFDATQPDGSYGSWQKIINASDTGSVAATGAWSLSSNGDTVIPKDGRYLVTYLSTGDGLDVNWARVIVGINHSRSGTTLNAFSNFRNQFGTFTNPNSVYSGYSDGAHSVEYTGVYRCLAGDLLEFYGQGDLNSPFSVRVSITYLGDL